MKDKSVQLCCFSPPYWGLRKYSVNPLVWGGDSECRHEWGVTGPEHHPGQVEQTKWKDAKAAGHGQTAGSGQFCQPCGAWRGDLGLEPTPELYLDHMMLVMSEVWRVLRDDGVCFVNLGDSYSGSGKAGSNPEYQERHTEFGKSSIHKERFGLSGIKPKGIPAKSLCLIPQKFAIRCQEAGWIIRSEIIWAKPNPMPESVKDRPTRSHEQIWLMVKQGRYYWDQDAVAEPQVEYERVRRLGEKERGLDTVYNIAQDGQTGLADQSQTGAVRNVAVRHELAEKGTRNVRDVWICATEPTPEAHFATWPMKLIEKMIRAGSSPRVCPKCHAPWMRVVQKPDMTQRPIRASGSKMNTDTVHLSNNWQGIPKSAGQQYQEWRNANPDKTIGWQSTCSCPDNDGSGKSIVLDPFCGTAKTVLKAEELNRIGVGMDLSWEYILDIAKVKYDRPLQRELYVANP